MSKDNDQLITKDDLRKLELGIDTKLEALELRIDTKLEVIKDEIIRAFRMTEENIRQDAAHVDEVQELSNRITRIEDHLGIEKQ